MYPDPSPGESRRHPFANDAERINGNGDDFTARAGLRRLWWPALALLLAVALGWQLQYPANDRGDQPPLVGVVCKIFNCALPPQKDVRRLTLTHTRIDLHPSAPGALRVTIKLVNEATFAQPWPDLQVTLTDRAGRVVGRRAFAPRAYLTDGQPPLLNSGDLGVARLDLAHPHEQAVGFEVTVITARS